MGWEYKVIRAEAHPNDVFTAIARAGKEGWELVGPVGYYLYLKRPISAPLATQEADNER